VEIVQEAQQPRVADQDRQIQLTVLAGLGGFACPVALILWWDTRGKRINTPAEVVRTTGLDLLGTVPLVPAKAAKQLHSEGKRYHHWRAIFTESVRGIAARLIRQAKEDETRVVLVTSAFGGEGKTTVASQLAISLAEMGQKTILIDFDLRRPSLDGVFGIENDRGVSEILRGEAKWQQVCRDSGIENLDIIPAGQWSYRGMAVLANGVVGGLFRSLREQYDFVIVDGSPVLPVADTRFVSMHVDGVVMSVLRDVSRMPKVHAAYRTLAAFDAKILGAIVTGNPGEAYYHDPRYTHYIDAADEPEPVSADETG
ncbi:MAG: tyrosine-protein kinase family protein, partial [Planctomycetota bacterium]